MKKNPNTANANYIVIKALLLLALLVTSCEENLQLQPSNDGNIDASSKVSNAAGKPTSLPTVSLEVTVLNTDATGNVYNIQNDGRGGYKNGIDNVQAILDGAGTFAFNTQASTRKAAVRWVSYNFNDPVDPSNSYRPTPSNSRNYHFSTGGSVYGTNPFIPLQNLGVNGNPSTECIYMGNGLSNSTTGWRVSFHKGLEDTESSQTAFAVVTRTKIKAIDGVDEWVITPIGSCTVNSNVAALRSNDGSVLYGYYNIPFFFTMRGL